MTAIALPAGRIPLTKPHERLTLRETWERVQRKLREFGLEAQEPTILHMAPGFSDGVETKILDHVFNDPSYTAPTPYLALCTAVPTETNSAGTITEAAYTGYARLAVAAGDMGAAAAGAKSNSAALTFAACTGSTSTIIGWGICSSSSGAGDLILYGSCTSTVISTTQTPATVAIAGLSATLD